MKKILVFLILLYVNCFSQSIDFPFAAMYSGTTVQPPSGTLSLDGAYADNDTTVILNFSEAVEQTTAETASNYLLTSGEGGNSTATRVWIDMDTDNEIDDYYAILRFFVDSSVVIEGLSSAHHGIAGSADITANQTANTDMLSQIGWTSDIVAPQGQTDALVNSTTYTQSDACDSIITAAHRGSASNKLIVFCGGAFSNVASAVLKDPTIVPKITISVMGYNYNSSVLQANDFNAFNDVNASTAIMNSGAEIIIMPANPVSSQLSFLKADSESHLLGEGTVWDYVHQTWIDKFNGYTSRTLWDIAGVEALLDTNLATWDYNVSFGGRSDLTVASDIDQAAMVTRYWAAIDAGIAGTRAKVLSDISPTADTINVVSAVRSPDSVVTLTTAAHTPGIEYLATVSNVQDLSSNVIASPNDTASYVYTAPVPPDTIPNAFVFTDVTDATVSTEYISNTIILAGFDSAYASISGTGTFVINTGSYGTTTAKVYTGDSIKVKITSSASNSTALTGTITVGGVSDGYTVTTEAGAVTYTLEDDFSDGDYTNNPTWTVQNGTFTVDTSVAHDWKDNNWALSPTGLNLAISTPCTTAYGTWIFDFYHSSTPTSADVLDLAFIMDDADVWSTGNNGYLLSTWNNKITLYRITSGSSTNLFLTADNYLAKDTFYSIKIERNVSNQFTVSVMGGAYGTSGWTEVVESSGSNPVTDANHTTSTHFVIGQWDTNMRITNITVEE